MLSVAVRTDHAGPGGAPGGAPDLAPRALAASVDELLAGATGREPFRPRETRSGTAFERVWIDGRPHVVKYLHPDDDFTMRASGDVGSRSLRAFAAGLYDAAPDLVDHAILGAAGGVGRNGWGAAFLMRDVSGELLPPGDVPFPEEWHARFLDSLAGLCAATWGWRDELDLMPYGARWSFFGRPAIEAEAAAGWPEPVPRIASEGWDRFAERAPAALAAAVADLLRDPAPLVDALVATPSCFLHGDWKASNLGAGTDGRTLLLDWVYLGEGPACNELGWYLALNRTRLPAGHTKERAIDDFRAALERHGVATAPWWERQLDLCLLGSVVQFGWEKALGDERELGWWCDRATAGLHRL